jgi:hypothetical protein
MSDSVPRRVTWGIGGIQGFGVLILEGVIEIAQAPPQQIQDGGASLDVEGDSTNKFMAFESTCAMTYDIVFGFQNRTQSFAEGREPDTDKPTAFGQGVEFCLNYLDKFPRNYGET